MSSFPTRFNRSHLGPKLVNTAPVENPESQVGDKSFNAAFAAVAGMNLVVPRVVVLARYVGGDLIVDYRAEAWNPDGDKVRPLFERTGAGAYRLTFAGSYPDENGVEVPTVLLAARVSVHKVSPLYTDHVRSLAYVDPGNPLRIQVRMWLSSSSSPVDEPFWLEVF